MGKKKNSRNKSSTPASAEVEETSEANHKEFQLDLRALDGYDLPGSNSEEETGEEEPSKKRKRGIPESKPEVLGIDYREREEQRLEELLFGDLVQKFREADASNILDPSGSDNLVKTNSAKTKQVEEVLPDDVYGKNLGLQNDSQRKAAWVDEDDEEIKLKDVVAGYSKGTHGSKETSETNYKKYLEKSFVSVHGELTPKWAQLRTKDKKKKKSNDADALTKTATDLLTKDSVSLPQTILKVTKLKDINKESRAEGAIIKSIEFHKKQSVALVAGNSGIVSLFQVDGRKNAKIQSVKLNQFPVHIAHFSADGEEFVASSNLTGNIQIYNLVTGRNRIVPHNKEMEKGSYKNFVISPNGKLIAFQGRFGNIHLMSATSKEWISTLKANGDVHSMTFNPDGTRLYSHGEFGEVYVWDMNARQCVHKFVDDGCILGTSIAISPTQQYLACGSSTGVVNLYSTHKLENNAVPVPDKVLLNLVTRTGGINFHASSELMSMFSNEKENAVRLVHFPSMTVFKNFPQADKGNSMVNSMDFSPNGGYMGIGLNNGTAQLFRLHHYDQY